MEKEIWKDVIGYEGRYLVSNYGRVMSIGFWFKQKDINGNTYDNYKPTTILTLQTNTHGYYSVNLYNGSRKACSVHRLVANAFISNPNNKPQVNHKNGVRNDNRVENLEWVTNGENAKHSYDYLNRKSTRGITKYSKKVKQFSLSGNFIKEYINAKEAYRQTGISHTCICACIRGERRQSGGFIWKH